MECVDYLYSMKLIFVYNAVSGAVQALLDTAHKIVSPDTYPCELCDLTHGVFKEREEWLRFRESLDIPTLFLHKDEFLKQYRSKWLPKYDFPIVLIELDGNLEIAISKRELQNLKTPQDLIDAVHNVLVVYQN